MLVAGLRVILGIKLAHLRARLFVDALKELQPTAGHMRLAKEHVPRAWERKTEVCRDVADTVESQADG